MFVSSILGSTVRSTIISVKVLTSVASVDVQSIEMMVKKLKIRFSPADILLINTDCNQVYCCSGLGCIGHLCSFERCGFVVRGLGRLDFVQLPGRRGTEVNFRTRTGTISEQNQVFELDSQVFEQNSRTILHIFFILPTVLAQLNGTALTQLMHGCLASFTVFVFNKSVASRSPCILVSRYLNVHSGLKLWNLPQIVFSCVVVDVS